MSFDTIADFMLSGSEWSIWVWIVLAVMAWKLLFGTGSGGWSSGGDGGGFWDGGCDGGDGGD